MTALKTLRHDLGTHLATGLHVAHAPLGAQVNPPAVVVRPVTPYITTSTYCVDAILFEAIVITKPGDLAAVTDALDDLIDGVRDTLRVPSDTGNRFAFREVSGPFMYASGDLEFPSVAVTIGIEREHP